MRIDWCEYAHQVNDNKWYCSRRHCCPYEKCEVAEAIQNQKPPTVTAYLKEIPGKDRKRRQDKYDFQAVVQTVVVLRKQKKMWKEIAEVVGIPRRRLCEYAKRYEIEIGI